MIRAVKFYRVSPKDINEHGELKPDASLLPYYIDSMIGNPNFNPTETYASDDKYNNDTNLYQNRFYNIYDVAKSDDNPDPDYELVPANKRGYSVLAYDKGDRDLLDGFNDPDYNWIKKNSEKVKQLPNKPGHDRPDINRSLLYRKTSDNGPIDKEQKNISKAIFNDKIRKLLSRKDDAYQPVPFIVQADDEDEITLDDVVKGYDAGRDYNEERQLKNIHMKQLPSGIIIPREQHRRKELTAKACECYDGIDKILTSIESLSDKFNAESAYDSIVTFMDNLPPVLYLAMYAPASDKVAKDVYKKAKDLQDYIEKIDFNSFSQDDLETFYSRAYQLVMSLYNFDPNDVMEEIIAHDKETKTPFMFNQNLDVKEFTDKYFNWDDPHNISDYHAKIIRKDFFNDFGHKKTTSNILKGMHRI